MAHSLASLSKRRKTIKTTQKITNAMKLVSISKLQRYRLMLQDFIPIYDFLVSIPSCDIEDDREVLYLVFAPDLGLASVYTRELMQFIKKLENPQCVYIGTQGYEELVEDKNVRVLNEKMNGDHLDPELIVDLCQNYQKNYRIIIIVGYSHLSQGVEFKEINTSRSLCKEYQQVFEPNYENVNRTYHDMLVRVMIVHSYYTSKMSEYMLRRVAMEKASENAEKILDDLQLQYNRLRQEKITEEIADLVSAESEVR